MINHHRFMIFLLLLPAVFGLLYLTANLFGLLSESVTGLLETWPFPLFTIILTIVVLAYTKKPLHANTSRTQWAYAIPGFMAPTALFSAWTLAPSHIGGVAWGGIHYFLEAVNRYPDFGPVNSMVFLGLLAVLGASFLPVIIALGYISAWPIYITSVLGLVSITAYIIVAVNLDFNLWLAGFYGADQDSLLFLLYGPLSRTLALIAVVYLVIRLLLDNKKV